MTIEYGEYAPDEVNVVVEIPAHSDPIKYEVDKDTGAIFVDRFMATCMHYPCNYGYIPATHSEDGDPLDVLVITPFAVNSGAIVVCRPVGLLDMTDEAGPDLKLLAVPCNRVCTLYDDIHKPEDMPRLIIRQIEHFFQHYKDLEDNKWVEIHGWRDANDAKQAITEGIERYRDLCQSNMTGTT